MTNIDHITVEVRPTVSLESAVACVMMLNLFLRENDEYRLELQDDGDGIKWRLTDKPHKGEYATGGTMPERSFTRDDIAECFGVSTALLDATLDEGRWQAYKDGVPRVTLSDEQVAEWTAHLRKLAGLEDE